ncbi:MAG TPA: hypothetical protein VL326_14540 [Kofleriaceae bacterium]|jgi:hypothetical protein|nr:hypothetical protein [Kofleriaceae bacterium]
MAGTRDRRGALEAQTHLNGIDFVEVLDDTETRLRVHFINKQPDKTTLATAIVSATITGGDTIPVIAVRPLSATDWGVDSENRPWLDVAVPAPGDFSTYTLRLTSSAAVLDRYFDHAGFSFKARCPSPLDCEPPPLVCPPATDDTPPIDYLAKDFDSFKLALSDFSALRYPAWKERSEADFGVMFMESLASIADDLSYLQDRLAAEAWLETATQRRSLTRLARLVDYEPLPAVAARTWLRIEVADGWSGDIRPGVVVNALAPDGGDVVFETGTGLDDDHVYPAASEWNRIRAYWWDDSEQCLPAGATSMWIEDPGRALAPGRWLLIETAAEVAGDPPQRQLVRLHEVEAVTDPLFPTTTLTPTPVVRITWYAEQALAHARDLARTTIFANLVPATQGRRHVEQFFTSATPALSSPSLPRAIVRTGANHSTDFPSPQFLYTLREAPLAWLEQDDPLEKPRPELLVFELGRSTRTPWDWHRSLLEATVEPAVTVDPIRYRDVGSGFAEYDDDDGATLRFGDGVFGPIPTDGTIFEVLYRVGGGTLGNVAADAIDRIDPSDSLASVITDIGNPFAAVGGKDAEPAARVRDLAPQAFRARQFRAVRAEDYDKAITTNLKWAQRAGTTFRWTGSWLSVFSAVDPKGSEVLPVDRLLELARLQDRYRLAGYEAFPLAPRYASLDLAITVCARPDAFRGDVERAVSTALDTTDHPDGGRGFFHPDEFTFGLPLERSRLEAAIQDVPGVDGVVNVRYRRRGYTPDFVAMGDAVQVGRDEIVRVDSNPNHPDRGSVRIDVVGGK